MQDEVTVNVVRLTGIKIHAPLTRLQSGTTVSYFLFVYLTLIMWPLVPSFILI